MCLQAKSKSDSHKHLATKIQAVRGGREIDKYSLNIYTDHFQCNVNEVYSLN